MKVFENGHRYRNIEMYEDKLHQPYDYKKRGLIRHLLSRDIINSKNEVLKKLLAFYEQSLIFLMRFTDILRNFKNYNWKNR